MCIYIYIYMYVYIYICVCSYVYAMILRTLGVSDFVYLMGVALVIPIHHT